MFREIVPDRKGIFLPSIEIQEHPQKGYICVATSDISALTLIERCPTVKLAAGLLIDFWRLNDNKRVTMHDYVFLRGGNGNTFSYFSMGYGGIYSHSDNPNARWTITEQPNGRETVDIRAVRDIKKGEEVTIRYVRNSENLWFAQAEEDSTSST